MKTNTPAVRPPANPPLVGAGSITIPLQAVPTVWKRAAKDLGFPSVEDWAVAMLDDAAWPGNRMKLTSTDSQFERWGSAAVTQGKNLREWIEGSLDAASHATETPQKGGHP